MVCNNCRYQSPDGLNFCPNCGIAFNPQFARPYQPPQSFQQGFPSGQTGNNPEEQSQKSIFRLGIIAFSVNFFWIAFNFIIGFFGYGFYEQFHFVFRFITLITTVATLFFAFIFVKKQSYKTLLLILFIVLFLFEVYEIFLRDYMGRMF